MRTVLRAKRRIPRVESRKSRVSSMPPPGTEAPVRNFLTQKTLFAIQLDECKNVEASGAAELVAVEST